jgi:hypothetical protein
MPETEQIIARDVVPYEWALWCRVAGGEAFANHIVGKRPSECGEYLWFMLDSHNFWKVKPDDVLALIPLLPMAQEVA